jgi:tetratricopeptide (TPR) repeat protein
MGVSFAQISREDEPEVVAKNLHSIFTLLTAESALWDYHGCRSLSRIQPVRSRCNVCNIHDLFRNLKISAIGLCLAGPLFTATGQSSSADPAQESLDTTGSRAELNQGVEACKGAHYAEAIAHFQRAVELDPNQPMAKTYLGTALAQNVVPGLDTPDNLKTAQQAIDIFQQVLADAPHDVNSMKQVAGIYFSIKKLDEAKSWQKRVLDENPRDPEAAYTIGVIDWTLAHRNVLVALTAVGLNDDGEGNTQAPAAAMANIRGRNFALVEEALLYLNQAIENRPGYSDAMAYVNLTYRRKADVDWGNDDARQQDLANANEWAARAMAARKAQQGKGNRSPDSQQP